MLDVRIEKSFRFLGTCGLSLLLAFSLVGALFGQSASADHAISANELARAVVANELKAQDENQGRWMYCADREEQGKTKTKKWSRPGKAHSTDCWRLTDTR